MLNGLSEVFEKISARIFREILTIFAFFLRPRSDDQLATDEN